MPPELIAITNLFSAAPLELELEELELDELELDELEADELELEELKPALSPPHALTISAMEHNINRPPTGTPWATESILSFSTCRIRFSKQLIIAQAAKL